MKKLIKITFNILGILVVIGLILAVAHYTGLLTGNPKGIDIYAYLTKIKLILQNFPHINWNPYWDSGTPFSIWSYPPAAMLTVSLMVKLGELTPEVGLTVLGIVSYLLLGLGVYGFISYVGKNKLVALLTVLVLVSSPTTWSWWNGGNYVRVFGLGMTGLVLLAVPRYLKSLVNKTTSKWLYLASVFSFALALMSHLLLGGISLVLVFLLFFFSELSLRRKIKEFLKLFLPAFALAAYWYLPMYLTGKPASRFFGKDPADPIRLINFVRPTFGEENFSLSVNVLPFVGVGFLTFLIVSAFKKLHIERFQKGILYTFFIASLGGLAYNIIGYLPFYPKTGYIVGFPPITAFALFGILVVIFSGIFLAVVLQGFPKVVRYIIPLLLIVLAFFGLERSLIHLKGGVGDVISEGSLQSLNMQVVSVKSPQNFRYGTDNAFVADWFNYKFNAYQSRDYFGQGITYPDWQNWFETAIWYWEGNYPETKFLLDWYGVKEFFVGNPHFKFQKFLNNPDFAVEEAKTLTWIKDQPPLNLYQFSYPVASSILSARNTPVVMVVGKKEGYDYFLRALAKTGLDSTKIIPIRGGGRLDQIDLSQISKFDGLVLYEYTYQNEEKAMEVISSFLKMGKTVYWETHLSPDSGSKINSYLPVAKITNERIWDNWEVQKAGSIASGSEVVKEEGGSPLVVSRNVGPGKVIWSGINLPYLILEKKSESDISFLKNLLNQAYIDGKGGGEVVSKVSFTNPEKREVSLNLPAKGVLLKESYFANWEAKVNGKEAKIYQAGPDLMYVFLSDKSVNKVVFEYKLSVIEIAGWLITITALLVLLLYLFEGFLLPRGLFEKVFAPFDRIFNKTSKNISGWWQEEGD